MQPHPIRRVTDAIAKRWASWRSARAGATDLACCDPAEVKRIAHDLNLPSDELRSLAARDAGSADLLYARLAVVGIDPKAIEAVVPEVMRDMQRCCSDCGEKSRCSGELESGVGSALPAYCPNQETLTALAVIKCH